jgi:hypothetical protein
MADDEDLLVSSAAAIVVPVVTRRKKLDVKDLVWCGRGPTNGVNLVAMKH